MYNPLSGSGKGLFWLFWGIWAKWGILGPYPESMVRGSEAYHGPHRTPPDPVWPKYPQIPYFREIPQNSPFYPILPHFSRFELFQGYWAETPKLGYLRDFLLVQALFRVCRTLDLDPGMSYPGEPWIWERSSCTQGLTLGSCFGTLRR